MVGELLQRSQFSPPPPAEDSSHRDKTSLDSRTSEPERSGVESHLLAETWRALREEEEEEEVREGAVIREREAEGGRRGR